MCAGVSSVSFAAVLSRLYPASVAATAGARADADLTITQDVLLGHGPVSITTDAISVAIVAIVAVVSIAVGYSVIYQGSVLVLAELADQLGFQS